jgi:glycosyltransferase involved in cell wall biosynthesis
MTRIIIDPQTFISQEYGGISRYFTELFTQFQGDKELELSFPILYTDNRHYIESPFFRHSYQEKYALLIKFSKLFRPFLPRKLKKKSERYAIDLLREQKFDLFIPTYYDPYFLPYLSGKPFVLTVHDMIHELYPSLFPDDVQTAINKKKLIKEATKIIAVSENTRKDILRIYPSVPAEKIEVVYLAHHFVNKSSQASCLPDHYILFVGNRGIYKNFNFFITAIAPLFQKYPELHVVCAGGNPFDEAELSLISKLEVSKRVIQQSFKDEELKSYYENARCFVFPSAYEGFGIPVLEAMSAGCPIILTHNSSFPEVAGEAGIYFELNNGANLLEKVDLAWSNEELRLKHRKKGIEQALKFRWSKTARETLHVYQQALKT